MPITNLILYGASLCIDWDNVIVNVCQGHVIKSSCYFNLPKSPSVKSSCLASLSESVALGQRVGRQPREPRLPVPLVLRRLLPALVVELDGGQLVAEQIAAPRRRVVVRALLVLVARHGGAQLVLDTQVGEEQEGLGGQEAVLDSGGRGGLGLLAVSNNMRTTAVNETFIL